MGHDKDAQQLTRFIDLGDLRNTQKKKRLMITTPPSRAKCVDNFTIEVQAPLCCALMARTNLATRCLTAMASPCNGRDGSVRWPTVSR